MRTYKDIENLRIFIDVPEIKGWVIQMDIRDQSSPTGMRYATFSIDFPIKPEEDFLKVVFESIKLQLEVGDEWRE